jgi:hypothetical protein
MAVLLFTGLIPLRSEAQGVLLGPVDAPPDPSALLHIDGSTLAADAKKGVIFPQVQLTRLDDPAPITPPMALPPSLVVYNIARTTIAGPDSIYNVWPGYYHWDGSRWLRFESGVRKQVYYNCTDQPVTPAVLTVPHRTNWGSTAATIGSHIPLGFASGAPQHTGGLSPPSSVGPGTALVLVAGDQVFLEAYGAVELTGTLNENFFEEVEVELVASNSATAWSGPWNVVARTRLTFDLRYNDPSVSFLFGLYTQGGTPVQQRIGVRHFNLQGIFTVGTTSTNYRFWVRMRKINNVSTNVITTGGAGDLQGCLRTEVFRQ